MDRGGRRPLRRHPDAPLRARHAAVDVPVAAPRAEPASPRPWWRRPPALVAAAAVRVAAVVVGVLTLGGGSGGASSSAAAGGGGPAAVSVSGGLEQAASGLSVLRQAEYDPAHRQVTVTVTYTAASAALTGPFFETVPATAPGAPCPDVVWDGTGAVHDTTVGIDPSACGWEVDVATVGAGSQVQARYSLPYTPAKGTDPRTALAAQLAAAQKQTSAALDQLTAGTAYPAQRLESLEVEIAGSVRVASQIPVVVLPVWSGASSADYVDPLFDSATGRQGALVQALGGTLALSSPDCGSAIGFTGNAPYANQPAQRCTVTAQLGQLRGASRTFDIGLNSTG